jgi:hypothetical protein
MVGMLEVIRSYETSLNHYGGQRRRAVEIADALYRGPDTLHVLGW